ncbi:hypothetical protein LAZ67_13000921 [Cordylochernes scorpioides]|uniref:GPN-loop GTPase 2 n=1 Tax=Cordylochernes scorpioides TaxID=51811 RepID=A0ABY6L3D8_9ARAC|nr:hypothetical protein LAZ67_13000921 [Cordylochernes scorpioides]
MDMTSPRIERQMRYGQLVVGPPGAGKTTYCREVAAYLERNGRKVAVVNLDPANDKLPYTAAVDINDLVTVEEVMEHCNLGPNGSILRSMEYLEEKFDWLQAALNKIPLDVYLVFDFPGQIELYIDHHSVKNVITRLSKLEYHLAVVHIVDSQHCTDPAKFISVLLQTLASMIQCKAYTWLVGW